MLLSQLTRYAPPPNSFLDAVIVPGLIWFAMTGITVLLATSAYRRRGEGYTAFKIAAWLWLLVTIVIMIYLMTLPQDWSQLPKLQPVK